MTLLLRVGACKWIILAGASSGHYDSTVVFLSIYSDWLLLNDTTCFSNFGLDIHNPINHLANSKNAFWGSPLVPGIPRTDVFFCSLIFDFDQAEWLREACKDIKAWKEIRRWCAGCVSDIRHTVWTYHNFGNDSYRFQELRHCRDNHWGFEEHWFKNDLYVLRYKLQ